MSLLESKTRFDQWMNGEKNTALSFFLLISWVPSRHFYGKGHVFPRELGRIISHVTKEPPKICVHGLLSISESPEDIYPFSFRPFQP